MVLVEEAGAGAGIGGNGGNGGTSTGAATGTSVEYAGAGETAGTINIYSEVYAYGGSGGSTGSVKVYSGSSTGAGGYPGAGIGGGRCWWPEAVEMLVAGGGFTGGHAEMIYSVLSPAIDGLTGNRTEVPHTARQPGGGYFESKYNSSYVYSGIIGGGGSTQSPWMGGFGGTAGSGGVVNLYIAMSKVYAYNGSYKTGYKSGDSNNQWGYYQCPIYLQLGISIDNLKNAKLLEVNTRTGDQVKNELNSYKNSSIEVLQYTNSQPLVDENKNIGIGSGAGYFEVSNGKLNINS